MQSLERTFSGPLEPPPRGFTGSFHDADVGYLPLSGEPSRVQAGDATAKAAGAAAGGIASWFPAYRGMNMSQDLSGGCILALVVLMQGVACSSIAGTSPLTGPYSGIAPPLVYGLLGTSRHLSVGGGALVAMVVAEQVTGDAAERTHQAQVLALLAGAIMFAMGTFGLAFLVRFVSRPALSGLISASGLLLIVSQRASLLGVPKASANSFASVASDIDWPTVALSSCLVALLLSLQRLKGRGGLIGRLASLKELLAVALGTLLALLLAQRGLPVALLGEVPAGLPGPSWPLAGMARADIIAHLPGATVVALTSFITSYAGAKSVALRKGYDMDAGREMQGLGLSSFCGGLLGGMPVMGSLNRTALAAEVVCSQLGAGAAVTGTTVLILRFFTPLLRFLPTCSVAALIATSSLPLVNFQKPLELFRMHEKNDLAAWAVAFIATLQMGIVNGIGIAVALSLVLLLYEVVQPVVQVLGRTPAGLWVTLGNRSAGGQQVPGVLVLRVDGPIFFANAEYFQERVLRLASRAAAAAEEAGGAPVEKVLLEASKISFLDATAVEVLHETAQGLKERGLSFAIVEAPARAHATLQRCVPELHPKAERGFRVTVNEALGLEGAAAAEL